MSDTKNLIITILLSTLILIGWQYFYETPRQEKVTQTKQQIQQDEIKKAESQDIPLINRDQSLEHSLSHRVKLNNGKVAGSINLRGARIDDLSLLEYDSTLEPGSKKVVLLSPSNTKESYFAEFGWVSGTENIEMPNSETLWEANKNQISFDEPVILSWQNSQGIRFEIIITLDDNCMFNIKQNVKNLSGEQITISNYATINKQVADVKNPYSVLHEGPMGVFKGILFEVGYSDLKNGEKKDFHENLAGDWIGITDKYWLTAISPVDQPNFTAEILRKSRPNKEMFQTDYVTQPRNLAPGQSHENNNNFFAGAKKLKLLDQYAKTYNLTLFDRAVDFGWFYFITKPMFYALQIIYAGVKNFGLAILLITVLVKLLMLPLANKSYKSMNKMKTLQPQLTRLRERYEGDKMQLNKEIMHLYKKEEVNPLAGCVPLIIQIPVFFSLYKVFFITIICS
jgi:YidC/Oxa1 family membrane protein insertase